MKGILDYGIIYHANKKLDPHSYINLNFASDKDTQRSTERNMFFVTSEPVS